MCLFPGGGFSMQPIAPPTDIGMKHKQKLYVILVIHLVLSITMMFVSVVSGIYEMISIMILWCAATQMHYCHLIIYIIICGNKFIASFCTIGLTIQNGSIGSYFSAGGMRTFSMVLVIVFALFYVIAIYFAFKAYREFKGMLYDNDQGGAGMQGGALNGLMAGRRSSQINQQQQNPSQNYRYQPPNQQPQNTNYSLNDDGEAGAQPNQSSQQRGIYRPFAGSGVRIGGDN